jgi:TonB family protein
MRRAERLLCGWGVAVLACCVLSVSLGDEAANENTPHLMLPDSKIGTIDWYPVQARRAGLEGRVLVAFNVTPAGQATNASIIWSEESIFEAPSLGFLARTHFKVPADWPGSALSPRIRVGFVFCLKPSGQSSDFAMPVEIITVTGSRLNGAPVRSKPSRGASGPCA